MIIYPAIDLKGGKCVRLTRGDMDAATVYNEDPAAQARTFQEYGFEWLHIVDLDGAVAGQPANAGTVRKILESVSMPVQLGGGIRALEQIEAWIAVGVSRVILGTAAVRNPALVKEACREFPGKIAVGIDARNGFVAVDGWVKDTDMRTVDLAKLFEDSGVAAIIHTDIERDGTGKGLNIEATLELARATSIPVIASGGAGSLEDLRAVAQASFNGVIVGKAFYDGRIRPEDAIALARNP